MPQRTKVLMGIVVLGSTLAVGACSGHSSGSAMHDDGSMMDDGMHQHGANSQRFPNARTVDVTARSFSFSPKRITGAAGEAVNIRLESVDALHDFTVSGEEVHVVAKAGKAAVGGMKIAEPGSYSFSCTVPGHRAAGMQGTIVVT